MNHQPQQLSVHDLPEFQEINLEPTIEPYEPTMVCKIDYYSSVWYSHSIRDVLTFLKLGNSIHLFLEDFKLVVNSTMGNVINFTYKGITLSVPFVDFVSIQKNVDDFVKTEEIKDFKFSTIRLNLSGQPLDLLRHYFFKLEGQAVSLDEYLRIPPKDLGLNFHPTRVDFAFDFINYGADFFDHAFGFLNDRRNLTPSGRLSITGLQHGITFKPINSPLERTLYIGSSGSDRYIRIYDKVLESKSRNKGVLGDTPFAGIHPMQIDSWIRFEWQLRSKSCGPTLYALPEGGATFWDALLQEVIIYYEFRSMRNQKPIPPKFWRNFFNVEFLGSLNKITDFVSKDGIVQKTDREKIDDYVEHRIIKSNLLYIMIHGENKFIQLHRRYFYELTAPCEDPARELIRSMSLRSFNNRMKSTLDPGLTLHEVYPHAFDENDNMIYPKGSFA